jgi:1-acyl-sn-glycerol-3-phosphate acyltransferase
MIIEAKPIPFPLYRLLMRPVLWIFRRRFNKMIINDIDIKPGHSYLLMTNHFGFFDGFFAYYLCFNYINKKQKLKGLYSMSVKKQMEKKWWLKYAGSFSVEPGKRSVNESLSYAAKLLSEPGNLLIFYPQGELESMYVRHIDFKEGLYEIISRTKGDCQLIWSSVLTEYFEGFKPSVYFDLLDCGDNKNFNFDALKNRINAHHLQSIKNNIRYTKE